MFTDEQFDLVASLSRNFRSPEVKKHTKDILTRFERVESLGRADALQIDTRVRPRVKEAINNILGKYDHLVSLNKLIDASDDLPLDNEAVFDLVIALHANKVSEAKRNNLFIYFVKGTSRSIVISLSGLHKDQLSRDIAQFKKRASLVDTVRRCI